MSKFNKELWLQKQKQRQSKNTSSDSKVNYFKVPLGKSYWKLLPPFSESGNPCFEARLYYGYKKDDNSRTVVKGLPARDCPLYAKYINALEDAETKEEKKEAKQFSGRKQFIYNAVNAETGEVGILQLTATIQDGIDSSFDTRFEEDEDFNPFDPNNSFVLKIVRTQEGSDLLSTRYTAGFMSMKDFKLDKSVDLNNLINLSKIYIEYTREQLEQIAETGFVLARAQGVSKVETKTSVRNKVVVEEEDVSVKPKKSAVQVALETEDDDDIDLDAALNELM